MSGPDHSSDSAAAPRSGWTVVHLFCKVGAGQAAGGPGPRGRLVSAGDALEAIEKACKNDHQVVTAAMLGHKADICVLGLGPDQAVLRELQTGLSAAGLEV